MKWVEAIGRWFSDPVISYVARDLLRPETPTSAAQKLLHVILSTTCCIQGFEHMKPTKRSLNCSIFLKKSISCGLRSPFHKHWIAKGKALCIDFEDSQIPTLAGKAWVFPTHLGFWFILDAQIFMALWGLWLKKLFLTLCLNSNYWVCVEVGEWVGELILKDCIIKESFPQDSSNIILYAVERWYLMNIFHFSMNILKFSGFFGF